VDDHTHTQGLLAPRVREAERRAQGDQPLRVPAPDTAGRPPSGLRRKLGAAGAAVLAALAKLKSLLLLLGNIKMFATAGTMLVSVAAYSFVFGGRSRSASWRCCSSTRWAT
jgi:hypothetical protein